MARPDSQLEASEPNPRADVPPIRVAGRTLVPTEVFDTYWRFAAARQAVYLGRLSGTPPPWTSDPILREHRFTNAYRAADRVSQFLIGRVIYGDGASQKPEDVVFRTLLFKVFNKVSTWQALEQRVGAIAWRTFEFDRYQRALDEIVRASPLYSAAYIIPPPRLGEANKRSDHLRLLERMMRDGLPSVVDGVRELRVVYERLRSYPSLGPFLAFQFAIDLNYSPVMDAREDQFVVAGPGARDGIRKCFGRNADGIEPDVVSYMAETQELHLDRLGLDFPGLFGRRLQLIDCQNLFCEVDKYARVAHPGARGISGRTRIKRRFTPLPEPLTAFFPPRWGLTPRVSEHIGTAQQALFAD